MQLGVQHGFVLSHPLYVIYTEEDLLVTEQNQTF